MVLLGFVLEFIGEWDLWVLLVWEGVYKGVNYRNEIFWVIGFILIFVLDLEKVGVGRVFLGLVN